MRLTRLGASALAQERQLLQQSRQWQCARCFHAAARRQAGAPQSRKERAAVLAEELAKVKTEEARPRGRRSEQSGADTQSPQQDGASTSDAASARRRSQPGAWRPTITSAGVPYRPADPSKVDLLCAGFGTSTPAVAHTGGVVVDHLARLAGEPRLPTPKAPQSAEFTAQKQAQGLPLFIAPGETGQRLPTPLQNELRQRLEKGRYYRAEDFSDVGQGKAFQGTLKTVLQQTVKNPLYTEEYVRKFADKVAQLLPAAKAPAAAGEKAKAA